MAALNYDLSSCYNYEKQRFGATTKKAGKHMRTQEEAGIRRKELESEKESEGRNWGRDEEEVRDRQRWAIFCG
jgi:hypothetical protein